MYTVLEYNGDNKIEINHIYCANLEANDTLVKGHRLLDSENKCVGLLSLDKKIEWNIKKKPLEGVNIIVIYVRMNGLDGVLANIMVRMFLLKICQFVKNTYMTDQKNI